MLPVKVPKDPAPSRAKYRLERLWLRPVVRLGVRLGLPLAVFGWIGVSVAMDPVVQTWVEARAHALRDRVAAHPGLEINALRLEGMSPAMADKVKEEMDLEMPLSSMDMDLGGLQKLVAALPEVASAQVQLAGGGVLRVMADERVPVLLWRNAEGLHLLDREGVAVGLIESRDIRPDLPVMAGEAANDAVGEALDLLAMAELLGARVRGIVRVGARRWTVSLDSGADILLPEIGAPAALARVMALHKAEDILNRDLAAIDMRDRRRPILRLTSEALLALRRARGLIGEDDA